MTGKTREGVEQVPEIDSSLVGIRGWLILPAIGLVLGSVIGVVALIAGFAVLSDIVSSRYGGMFALELLIHAGLLAYMLYAAALFFGEKSKAPSVLIAWLLVSLGASVFLLMIQIGLGAKEFAEEMAKQTVRDAFVAAIWIPYFRVSKRVQATFVN